MVVKIVGLLVSEVLAHVFDDQLPFANRPRGIATIRMNARLAKDKRHGSRLRRALLDFIWNLSSSRHRLSCELLATGRLEARGSKLAAHPTAIIQGWRISDPGSNVPPPPSG